MKNKYLYIIIFFILLSYKPAETSVNKYTTLVNQSFEKPVETFKVNSKVLYLIKNKIDEYYKNLYRQSAFNGCVLVAIDNQIIYKNALGYNDAKNKILLDTQNIFQMASVSKIFTATAVLKLYEAKKLNIHEHVIHYIPDFPYKDVTIYQLLNHTAGLPNYLYLMPEIGRQDTMLSHQSVLQFLIHKKPKPEFRPGKRHKYCNTNYAILACIIEKVSGMSYSDFLKKEIFIPCNMTKTNTIHYIDIFDENTTLSNEYKSRTVPFYAGDFILGDKSIYSNIQDLFRFSQMFLNKKILSDTTLKIMLSGVKTNHYDMLYGCGIRIKNYQDSSQMIWFHNGWWHGYRTCFQMRPKDKVTIIVLSNHIYKTTYYTQPIYEIIDEILYQKNNSSHPHQMYPSIDNE